MRNNVKVGLTGIRRALLFYSSNGTSSSVLLPLVERSLCTRWNVQTNEPFPSPFTPLLRWKLIIQFDMQKRRKIPTPIYIIPSSFGEEHVLDWNSIDETKRFYTSNVYIHRDYESSINVSFRSVRVYKRFTISFLSEWEITNERTNSFIFRDTKETSVEKKRNIDEISRFE